VIEFFRRAAIIPQRLGILAGSFNPPTRAHLALAHAATAHVDEVLFVLPREFPHKKYEGAPFAERIEMLRRAAGDPRFSIASTDGGLFIEIARECRDVYGDAALSFLCGRDAAERIVNWDYGDPEAFAAMLGEFDLRVASRGGEYEPPDHLRHAIQPLPVEGDYGDVSASDVRERIARGEHWEHLVPEAIVPLVRRIYGVTPASS
jgi:nicotinate (nicotinamide) nucleotide adenylyltransferase